MPASAATARPIQILRRPSRWLGAALVLLVLISTQAYVSVPLAASVSGLQRLDLSEILFAILGLFLAVRLIVFGDHRKLDGQAKYLLWVYLLLVTVWVCIIVARRVITLNWVISVTLVEYLGFSLAWYLVFRLGWLSKRSMLLGALGLVTVTNAWGLFLVLLDGSRVRSSGLLSNINVYIGMVLLLAPLLLQWAINLDTKWLRLLTFANVTICVALVLTSGSRFALLVLPVLLAATAALIARGDGWRQMRELGVVATLSIVAVAALVLVNPNLRADLLRATSLEETPSTTRSISVSPSHPVTGSPTGSPSSPIASSGPPTAPGQTSQRPGPTASATSASRSPSSGPNPSTRPVDTGDPDYEAPYDVPPELTHGRILKRSLAVLENTWLWGTGRPVIFFDGWGYHPPHNLFLEVLIFVGVVGAVPYFMIGLFIPVVALVRLRFGVFRSSYLLGLVGLLGYSLLQPLITDQLVLLLLVWGIFGAKMGPGRASWQELKEA